MKRFVLFTALALTALGTSGCSVNPATGQQSFTGLMSAEKEIQVGNEEHPKILQQYGGAFDSETLATYVDTLGQRLAKVSELPDIKWTFTVLDDPIINAFALPGGFVYISRGLIGLAENEAELAAVLGHEIGHVTGRHTAQRYSKSMLTGVGATILGIVVGGPAGDMANFAGQAYLAGYGRGHEMEADMLGMRYMTKLGYDPKASAAFFKKLAAHSELSARMKGEEAQEGHYSIFASHPDTQSRIVASQEIARTYPADLTLLRRSPYLRQIDNLIYGENPKQGVIDGQTFLHPDLRIAFNAPEGFKYINKPTVLAATHKNGTAFLFDMGQRDPSNTSVTQYLVNHWGKKYRLERVELLEVNKMEAATGEARTTIKNKPYNIRLLTIADGKDVFRFKFLTPTDLTRQMEVPLRQTTYSFHRLSYREAKKIKGDHIVLHKVGRGETIATLANRMSVEKLKEDWVKVINQEQLADGLQSGETVKLVVK